MAQATFMMHTCRPAVRAPQTPARPQASRRPHRQHAAAAAGMAMAIQLALSAPAFASVGTTPQDLKQNVDRATPDVELPSGSEAASKLAGDQLPSRDSVPSKDSLAEQSSATDVKAGGIAGGGFSVTSSASQAAADVGGRVKDSVSSAGSQAKSIGSSTLKDAKPSKGGGLLDAVKDKALTKNSPSVQLSDKAKK